MLTAFFVLTGLALLLGTLLRYSALRFKAKDDPLVVRIDALLPQTQCRQCGYAGCKPYAAAIAAGEADINQCPPGGEAGVRALAGLLGVAYKPLNPEHGQPKPKAVAVIDENICIGCTLCLQACPVDAILGAAKHMHTIIASECTGCELCIAPCPVDCISMEPVAETGGNWNWLHPRVRGRARAAANIARGRHEFRLMRIEREQQERMQKLAQKAAAAKAAASVPGKAATEAAKKAAIAAAIERARAQRVQPVPRAMQGGVKESGGAEQIDVQNGAPAGQASETGVSARHPSSQQGRDSREPVGEREDD